MFKIENRQKKRRKIYNFRYLVKEKKLKKSSKSFGVKAFLKENLFYMVLSKGHILIFSLFHLSTKKTYLL